MLKTKWMAVSLSLALVLTATGCGSTGGSSSEVMLNTDATKATKEEELKTTKVEKKDFVDDEYLTAEPYYSSVDSINMDVMNATFSKFKVKEGDTIKKGDVVATYYVTLDETELKKEKLEIEKDRNDYNAQLMTKENAITDAKKRIALMSGAEKKMKQIELGKMEQELKQFKESGKSITAREKDYQKTLASANKTKLVADKGGVVTKLEDLSAGDSVEQGVAVLTVRENKDFILAVDDSEGLLRYNMDVTVSLGGDRNDIRYKMKGKVISAGNLQSKSASADQEEADTTSYVRISKANREKYDFERNNIFVDFEAKRVDGALVVDIAALYEETEGENVVNYVQVVEDGKIHKRYVLVGFRTEKVAIIEQGVEEGQTLTIQS